METKIVDKVRENIKSYNSTKNGATYVHGITLTGDLQEWEYHSLSDKCTKFIPKQEATFTTEVRQNGNYTNHIIKPIQPQKQQGGGFKKSDPKDEGAITAMSIYSSTMNGLQGSMDVKDWNKVKERCELAWEWIKSKSDKK